MAWLAPLRARAPDARVAAGRDRRRQAVGGTKGILPAPPARREEESPDPSPVAGSPRIRGWADPVPRPSARALRVVLAAQEREAAQRRRRPPPPGQATDPSEWCFPPRIGRRPRRGGQCG